MAAGLCLSSAPANAAPANPGTAFQIDRFEPMPAQGINVLNLSTTGILPHLRPTAGLFFDYADDTLTVLRTTADNALTQRLIDHRLTGSLSVGMGFFDRISLSVVMPVVQSQSGDDLALAGRPGQSLSGAAVGDLRVVTKVRFWDPQDMGGFGVHLVVPAYMPTGDTSEFMGDGAMRIKPMIGIDYRDAAGFTVILNAGYHLRPVRVSHTYVSGPAFVWAAGVEIPTSYRPLSVVASVFGEIPSESRRDPLDPSVSTGVKDLPAELIGGIQWRITDDIALNAGAGSGIAGTVGRPNFRVFSSLTYAPTGALRDRDRDGLYDDDDKCPDAAEDLDGFEDDDGCPDPDNDGDGVPDLRDRCPLEAEDIDGFEDGDGCPELDNDGDGFPDARDACPNEAEDVDGYRDDDGCPEADNDGDGFPDAADRCPNEAEDVDGFQDGDGCRDPDNDGDGINDVNDTCPDAPETFNGIDDDDGCPDSRTRQFSVGAYEIKLKHSIHFANAQARILPQSYRLLDALADLIKANPHITRLAIEGHTDNRGHASANLKLSQARARAVTLYLVGRGVDSGILIPVGYGSKHPLVPNSSQANRLKNRRVVFRILEVNGRPVKDTEPGER